MVWATVAAATGDNMLTIKDLEETINALIPTVYYAFSDFVPSGEVVKCAESGMFPEFFVMRESDFEKFKSSIPLCNLVHIRDAKFKPKFKVYEPELPQEYKAVEYRFRFGW